MFIYDLKKVIFFFILIVNTAHLLYSDIISDLTTDYTITIEIKNNNENTDDILDQTSDVINDDETDDTELGNKWYSRHNFFIFQCTDMGVSGTKDFFTEYFLFKYRVKSKNRHAFAMRAFHFGYTNGIFSNNFTFYNFAILAGFEYFYKIFSPTEGFYIWTDIGGCNEGFSFTFGVGVGSRVKNSFELWALFMQNVGLFSRMEFNFLIFNVFTIRGKMGLDFKFADLQVDLFTFLGGVYLGFNVRNIFRFEIGGGFTVNEFSYFSGFGGVNITFNIW